MTRLLTILLAAVFAILGVENSIAEMNDCENGDLCQNKHDTNYSNSLFTHQNLNPIVDRKFWSKHVEVYIDDIAPKDTAFFLNETRFVQVVKHGCGSMKNRLLISERGEKYCARYRDNEDQLQGEYYSYLLSLLLQIKNVLPVLLLQIDPATNIWSTVWPVLNHSGWRPHMVIGLTRWLDDVGPVYAPNYVMNEKQWKCEKHVNQIKLMQANEAVFLLQWFDLLIFDYLTANVDRLVSQMYSLQWHAKALHLHVHNLVKTEEGFLLFLDNESGFAHSYRLMSRYGHFQEEILSQVCLSRRSLAGKIDRLSKTSITSIKEMLINSASYSSLLGDINMKVIETLKHRIVVVAKHLNSLSVR